MILLGVVAFLFTTSAEAFVSTKHQQVVTERYAMSDSLFTVGVIADIQYAPIPDGTSYSGVARFYRHALVQAKEAAEHFERDQVSLVVNLGDTIDGKCQTIEKDGGEPIIDGDAGHECIQHVIDALSPYQHGPIIHTYGNHELYNLNRKDIGKTLGIPFVSEGDELVGYRSYSHQGIRFVVLDTNDVSFLRPSGSRKREIAEQILAKENPNYPELENSPEGMEGVQKRFVAFNGAVDEPQMEWLRLTLEEAREAGEKVILLSHQPILPDSCGPVTLVWNYEEVLEVLRDFSDVIVLSLAGHAHKGGYRRDDVSGIHFRVVEAVLETKSPGTTYAMMHIHKDKVVFEGYGDCVTAEYDFSHCMKATSTDTVRSLL